jgi:hypothetical protein
MAGGDCVVPMKGSPQIQTRLFVCLGVVLRGHVGPEDVDLRISEGNLLTICLLHPT